MAAQRRSRRERCMTGRDERERAVHCANREGREGHTGTVYRGLYGNGELGSHGNVLRHTVSSVRLQDALLHLRNEVKMALGMGIVRLL
ncbi:hypothetical protein NQZ68_001781 [Dissostichus eleginoides]|nr:hypothetical protein NQZ68_001781 [Dissostichus eleginoides]